MSLSTMEPVAFSVDVTSELRLAAPLITTLILSVGTIVMGVGVLEFVLRFFALLFSLTSTLSTAGASGSSFAANLSGFESLCTSIGGTSSAVLALLIAAELAVLAPPDFAFSADFELELWTDFGCDEDDDDEDEVVDLPLVFELDEEILAFDEDFRLPEDAAGGPVGLGALAADSASFSEFESDKCVSEETGLYGGIGFTWPPFFWNTRKFERTVRRKMRTEFVTNIFIYQFTVMMLTISAIFYIIEIITSLFA